MILILLFILNGKVVVKVWELFENIINLKLKDLVEEWEEECFMFE